MYLRYLVTRRRGSEYAVIKLERLLPELLLEQHLKGVLRCAKLTKNVRLYHDLIFATIFAPNIG